MADPSVAPDVPSVTLTQALEDTISACIEAEAKRSHWALVSCKDTFVSLSTGYGKSIIYYIIYGVLPILFDKLNGKNNFHTHL